MPNNCAPACHVRPTNQAGSFTGKSVMYSLGSAACSLAASSAYCVQVVGTGRLYQLAVCGRILKRGNQDRKERAMARITRAALHVSVEEVKERMNNDPHPLYRKRWLIIYNALVDPREAKDIAKHTGVSVKTVHKLISTYNRLGIAAIETPGKGGRRNEYLTFEEEKELLTPFFELAKKGELTTVAQIKQEFEKKVGHEVDE